MSRNLGGAIVPSPGGQMSPQEIQERAVQVITPHDRQAYAPQAIQLCQRQAYGQLATFLDGYARKVQRDYLAMSVRQQEMHKETFDKFNSFWYHQFRPQVTQLAQAITANTHAVSANTQGLELNSRATAGNTIASRDNTAAIQALTGQVENLTVISQSLADQLGQNTHAQQQQRSLPVHVPQPTHHIHSCVDGIDSRLGWFFVFILFLGLIHPVWIPVVRVIHVPASPSQPTQQVPAQGGI